MSVNLIICGDCEHVLPLLPPARMVFLDPPDNLGVKYDGYEDNREDYYTWLCRVVYWSWHKAPIVWLSHYYRHTLGLMQCLPGYVKGADLRLFLWRYTFGQHRESDCGNGYRPILRIANPDIAWHTDAIRIRSARQRHKDKRANPQGRVPDDVWDFPRVCGNYKERRKWALNQHPEALMERMIRMSCQEGDLVVDAFGHSFSTARACRKLNVDCVSIEQSLGYCLRGAAEMETKVIQADEIPTYFPSPAPPAEGESHE